MIYNEFILIYDFSLIFLVSFDQRDFLFLYYKLFHTIYFPSKIQIYGTKMFVTTGRYPIWMFFLTFGRWNLNILATVFILRNLALTARKKSGVCEVTKILPIRNHAFISIMSTLHQTGAASYNVRNVRVNPSQTT